MRDSMCPNETIASIRRAMINEHLRRSREPVISEAERFSLHACPDIRSLPPVSIEQTRLQDALHSLERFQRQLESNDAVLAEPMPLADFLQQSLLENVIRQDVTVLQQTVPAAIDCSLIDCRVLRLLSQLLHYADESVLRCVSGHDDSVRVLFVGHQFVGTPAVVSIINGYFSTTEPMQLMDYFHLERAPAFIRFLHEYSYLCREIWAWLHLTGSTLTARELISDTPGLTPALGFELTLPQSVLRTRLPLAKVPVPEAVRYVYMDPQPEFSLNQWLQVCMDVPVEVVHNEDRFIRYVSSSTDTVVHYASTLDWQWSSLLDKATFAASAERVRVHADPKLACQYPTYTIDHNLVIAADERLLSTYRERAIFRYPTCVQKRIELLVLDDSDALHQSVKKNIQQFVKDTHHALEVTVHSATDYLQAISMLARQKRIDVVLVDYGLTIGSGFDFMMQRPANRLDVPCVLYTHYPISKEDYRRYGFADYIVKNSTVPLIPRLLHVLAEHAKSYV